MAPAASAAGAGAGGPGGATGGPSALLLFAAAGEPQLQSVPGLSVGIMSASQGTYSRAQLLLDLGQGARVGSSVYESATPAPLALVPAGGEGRIAGWAAALRRAARAPQILTPGLLASEIPGGAGYAGTSAGEALDAVSVADRSGRVGAVSLGTPGSLPARIGALLRRKRLIAADLPAGSEGVADLRTLAAERPSDELLLVIQRTDAQQTGKLLWTAAAGLPGGGGHELTSRSTSERGLIASADLAPAILAHLGRTSLPEAVRGKQIETSGARLDGAGLRSLAARLRVIGGRRIKALAFLLAAWTLLLLGCARRPAGRAWAMRAGGIGVLWAPVVVLIPAAIEPSAPVEYAIVALACIALGALSDRLLPWPRAPLAPALAALAAIVADALAHTQLLMRSLLGPNPILGARFYGVGNELKSALAVIVLGAVAGAMHPARRGRSAAVAMAGAGVVLAAIEGSARIGAGVGGVILVSAGFAVASVMLLPGVLTRRRALIVVLSPLAGLVALAALDLISAHGSGHYTGSVLHAHSAGEIKDIIVRRYKAAWGELHNHGMPVATALALACGAYGIARSERLLAPVRANPGWLAAFAGGFTAALAGALAEDSGPVLLVVGVFALGCLASYLWGAERVSPPTSSPGTPRAARSRARRPPAAPVR